MEKEFDNFLEDISQSFMVRNYSLWRNRLRLPFSLITKTGPTVLRTENAIVENYHYYIEACDMLNLTLIDRRQLQLENCHDGTWLGTFVTRLVSGQTLATNPYVTTELLHVEETRFVMSSMLNGRGHNEWTGMHGR